MSPRAFAACRASCPERGSIRAPSGPPASPAKGGDNDSELAQTQEGDDPPGQSRLPHEQEDFAMMDNTSLRDFASRAASSGRIRFGDLRRLQRNVLPNGITTREDAEALLDLNQAVSRADPDWPGWLSSALKAYAASGDGIDPQKAAWLAERLAAWRTKAAQTLARQLAIETRHTAERDAAAPHSNDLVYQTALAGEQDDVADEPGTGESVIPVSNGSDARAPS
jgi:hypothetical protein